MTFILRDERPDDLPAMRAIVTDAFATVIQSRGTEAALLDDLRRTGGLALSLVAIEAGEVIGQIAFSPLTVADGAAGWFGGGPLAVRPDRQRRGVGGALVRAGLERLRAAGGRGCVLVGDPAYYGRFGFASGLGPTLTGVPDEVVLTLAFAGDAPKGPVRFHPAFEAATR